MSEGMQAQEAQPGEPIQISQYQGLQTLLMSKEVTDPILFDKAIEEEKYTLYPFRWIIQFFFTLNEHFDKQKHFYFGLCLVSAGFLLVGFSSIATTISTVFECSQFFVQIQTLLFAFCFIPANFVVIYVNNKYGIKISLIIGCIMTIVGTWLRQLVTATGYFQVASFGTIIVALGIVFFINNSSKMASIWFGDKERGIATALGGLAMPVGCVLGFVIPATLVSDSDALDHEKGRRQVNQYIMIQNCIVTAGTLPLLILARNGPPTPPSASANSVEKPLSFKTGLKELLQNKSYLLLCVNFTCLYGIYTSLGAVVAALTKPYGYTSTDNAIFGGVFVFCGVAGSFILGIVLDKTQKYKLLLNIISFTAAVFIACGFYTLPSGNVPLFTVNLMIVGFSVIPVIPIGYSFAVELTYPLPEALSNGMMILPSQIVGVLMGVLAGVACDAADDPKNGPLYAVGMLSFFALIAGVSSLFIKEDLIRLKPPMLYKAMSEQPPQD